MAPSEWIAAYTAALIRQGGGDSSSALLARETARVHEETHGADVSKWPTIEQSLHPIFRTNDNTDIGIDDAEPEQERLD